MVFRIDTFCERWAEKFRLLQHDPTPGSKNKKFFRHDTYTRMEEFAQLLNQTKDTAMSVCTQFDGEFGTPGYGSEPTDPKFIRYTQRLYFWAQQRQGRLANTVDGELEAVDAKELTQVMAQKFVAWLEGMKKAEEKRDPRTAMLKGVRFGTMAIFTHPKKYNGWWATELVFEQFVPRELCVNEEDYVSDPFEV